MIIDNGKQFDFGKTSVDYAKYRDIYPSVFYEKILDRGFCKNGQTVLDVGTGTGVLPRNMYTHGAIWTGVDVSEQQIEHAKQLSVGRDIKYYVMSAENLNFCNNTFEIITACQCFWYFNHEATAPEFYRLLKANGTLLILYMDWLPYEDDIAMASEKLALKYNPMWSGAGKIAKPIEIPDCYLQYFEISYNNVYKVNIPFTRESWHGRMKTCRGIGASLSDFELKQWEQEHISMLEQLTPPNFEVLHCVSTLELKKKEVV